MKNYDYWKSFAKTGRIDDYLHYIACTREEIMDDTAQAADSSSQGLDISAECMKRDKEGGFFAGIS